MARPPNTGPTERELLLLKLLWKHGPSTVKHLRDLFPDQPRPAHTSLQTNLQGMLEKGYVSRDTSEASHRYSAAISRVQVEQSAVSDMIRRVFDGSAARLITTAITQERPTPEELERLQAMLDQSVSND